MGRWKFLVIFQQNYLDGWSYRRLMIIGPRNMLYEHGGREKYAVGPTIEDYKWYKVTVSQTRITGTPMYNFIVKINGNEVLNVINYHVQTMENVDLWSSSAKSNVSSM